MGHCDSSDRSGCGCRCQSKERSCCCKGSCSSGSCGTGYTCQKCGESDSGCNYAQKFLELADHAWMELLKEKIKEHIQSHAKHIDELAGLIAEANYERWQKKMDNKRCCGCYEEKLKEFFEKSCEVQKQKDKRG
jgi:hypothetical protein